MRVQATKAGFYAGTRRREGEEFDIHDDAKPASWMLQLEGGKVTNKAGKSQGKKAGKAEGQAADTLSAVGKEDAERDAKAEGQAADLV